MNLEEKKEEEKAQYAVRPHHRQKRLTDGKDDTLKYRNILNSVFMLLAIGGVIVYTQTEHRFIATVVLIAAVILKFVEVSLRMFRK